MKKRGKLTRAAIQKTTALAARFYNYGLHDLSPALFAKCFAQDARHRVLFNQELRRRERAENVMHYLPARLPARALRALAPQRIAVPAKELRAAASEREHDAQVIRVLRAAGPFDRLSASLKPWVQLPEHWQAYREFRTLWLQLQQAHMEFLCDGVPVAPLPPLRAQTAGWFRALGVRYSRSLRRHRELQLRKERPKVLRLSNDGGQFQSYCFDDHSSLTLGGDSAIEVHVSARRRRIKILRGEMQCMLESRLAWPWHVTAGPMKLQMHAAEHCWVGFLSPQQVYLQGLVSGLSISTAGKPSQSVPEALSDSQQNSMHLVCDGEQVRIMRADAIESRSLEPHTGVVTFREAPLLEVVHLLNRHNPEAPLKIEPGAEHITISGNFSLYHPQNVARFLSNKYGSRPCLAVEARA